jgi:hypothetical protein
MKYSIVTVIMASSVECDESAKKTGTGNENPVPVDDAVAN